MKPITRTTLFLAGAVILAGAACASQSPQVAPAPSAEAAEVPAPPQEAQEARHPSVDLEDESCLDCHRRMTRIAVRSWEEGPHGEVNVGCYVCHGDGVEEFFLQPPSDICLSCHTNQAVDFERVPHDGCFDCHGGHTLTYHEG